MSGTSEWFQGLKPAFLTCLKQELKLLPPKEKAKPKKKSKI